MINLEELKKLMAETEVARVEKTISTDNMDKFGEAICSFANDMANSQRKGYLLIGVTDDGRPSGLRVDDDLLKKVASIRTDGNILPLPVMTTERFALDGGDVLVVEVTPSQLPPVRYKGRTCIRIGAHKGYATQEEERILTERCAKTFPTFDARPCNNATIDDLDVNAVKYFYLPKAISADILSNDRRSIKEQLACLHLYNLEQDCPTYAGIMLCGKDPKYYMFGAYIQYVKFRGSTTAGEILHEHRFQGNLLEMFPKLETFIETSIAQCRQSARRSSRAIPNGRFVN